MSLRPEDRMRLDRNRRWARSTRSGAHGLRRGAWYLVVNESSKMVVLEVRGKNVPLPLDVVELSDTKPEAWSVVRWDEHQLGARRASERNMGLTYAVCVTCAERQVIVPPDAARMRCDSCGTDLPLDWAHPC